ncbi:cytidine deaminase [Streptomyces daliensis]|uniref:Cytidine deaminase n=1 Tax=Streptomyces daliensis TaxID=299421 RepID=A0A8T4ILT4_9ACTN|nr:cytidine deaminase [Streptomyces daliensis]
MTRAQRPDGVRAAAADVDWEALRRAARDAMSRAYAPYSRFPVGVAGLADDGRLLTGCNVENASYGVALCAECGLVSALADSGGGRLTAFTCADRNGDILMPCGRCRQLLWEHGGPELLMDTASGIRTLAELLPDAFGPSDLSR